MSGFWKKVIEGLEELNQKLAAGEDIPATRVEVCPSCQNDPELKASCPVCKRRGYIQYEVTL